MSIDYISLTKIFSDNFKNYSYELLEKVLNNINIEYSKKAEGYLADAMDSLK